MGVGDSAVGGVTCGVECVEKGVEPLGVITRVTGVAEFLIADRPEDNRRVVAVAEHQPTKLVILPVPMVLVPHLHVW